MRRDTAVRRTPIRAVTAAKAAIAAAAAGGLIAGCAPVQMGAAAIVGNQRISVGQLNRQVSVLAKAAKPYAGTIRLSKAQMPKQVLSWLIRFRIREELASRQHLTVTPGQTQQALAQIYTQAKQQAAQSGVSNVSLTELAAANGLPPDLLNELGRYQAVELAYAERANGGKLPTQQAAVQAITARFSHAECLTYKAAKIRVNPQYGTLDYRQQTVVAAPDTLSAAGGRKPAAGGSGSAPSC